MEEKLDELIVAVFAAANAARTGDANVEENVAVGIGMLDEYKAEYKKQRG